MTINQNTAKSIKTLAICMLIFAQFDLPYSYYQLLRWIICINSIFFAIQYNNNQNKYLAPLFTILAIIYNPIAPINIEKEVWIYINAITLLCIIHKDVLKNKNKILKYVEPLKNPYTNLKKKLNALFSRPLIVLCLLVALIAPLQNSPYIHDIGNLALNAEEEDLLRRQEDYFRLVESQSRLRELTQEEIDVYNKVQAKYDILKSSQGAAATLILTCLIWLLIYLPKTIYKYFKKHL